LVWVYALILIVVVIVVGGDFEAFSELVVIVLDVDGTAFWGLPLENITLLSFFI